MYMSHPSIATEQSVENTRLGNGYYLIHSPHLTCYPRLRLGFGDLACWPFMQCPCVRAQPHPGRLVLHLPPPFLHQEQPGTQGIATLIACSLECFTCCHP